MIIGVDAGTLSIGDERLKVGVWRVADNLIQELLKIDKKNTYRLYSFRPLAIGGQNVVLPNKGFFRIFLPLELRRRPVNVFLGLSQALPSFTGRTIGFIYDLGFLHYPQAYPDSLNKLKKQTENVVKHADQLVTISHSVADDIKRIYKADSLVCYPGVDKLFNPIGEKYKSKKPYFLFVGALKRGKNIPALIKSFANFSKSYDLLLIGGDYWLDPEIKIINGVKKLGFVPDKELLKYYRGATALVVPSLWEGFCLPIVEAMACGCPVVATNVGAMPEIIGNAGLVVEEDKLASAMKRISSDDLLREELITKGLKRAKDFSWTKMATSVLSLIQ